MKVCTGNCNQGRQPCDCVRGIELDYGKGERYLFLHNDRKYHKWDKYVNWIFAIILAFICFHVYKAFPL